MVKRLRNYFLAGLVVILPGVLTIVILRFLIIKLNLFLLVLLGPVTHFFPVLKSSPYLEEAAKAGAFILVILFIILIGLAVKVIILKNFFYFFEKMFIKVPMVNKIYIALKQLSRAFLGDQLKIFGNVVLVEYPRKGLYSIGFAINKTSGEISKKMANERLFNVFIPTTPNPTSGVFILVPEEQLTFLNITSEEALKLIVSFGKVFPGPSSDNTS